MWDHHPAKLVEEFSGLLNGILFATKFANARYRLLSREGESIDEAIIKSTYGTRSSQRKRKPASDIQNKAKVPAMISKHDR
jgi:hypothetical protein